MKVAILAGGLGMRLLDATHDRPKAMVDVGGRPILWHVMKGFANQGYTDFVIATGYQGDQLQGISDLGEPWDIKLVDTGEDSTTASRLRQLSAHLDQTFLLAWCDGVSDINFQAMTAFHREQDRLATVAAVFPPARFGHLQLNKDRVTAFDEKPHAQEGRINGGFFVMESEVFDIIGDQALSLEQGLLPRLAQTGELAAWRHDGFWQCMDTPQDRSQLEDLWNSGTAPWETWREDAA